MSDALTRRAFGGLSLAGLSACAVPDPLGVDLPEMGNFQLADTVVVPETAKKIPPSRNATDAELKHAMTSEIERRFGRYAGGKDFIIAVAIDGYALAPPGIPVLLTPKSILVVTANLWTAEPQEKIGGPHQITTFEGANSLLLGSGLVKDAEAQLTTLARNMASKIQSWMLRRPEWFDLPA